MFRSLALKGLMLLLTAGAVFTLLWHSAPLPDDTNHTPVSPFPMIVQSNPPPVDRPAPAIAVAPSAMPHATGTPIVQSSPTPRQNDHSRLTNKKGPEATAHFATHRLDLNRATLHDLERLPGVGPGLARHIMDYRTRHGAYARVEDLRAVKGIGSKRYAKLAPLLIVTTRPPSTVPNPARRDTPEPPVS